MNQDHDMGFKKESPLRRADEVAQGMMAGRVGLIEGVRELVDLRHGLFGHGDSDPDFQVIIDFEGKTAHLPVGAARRFWSPAALGEKDREIAESERVARAHVMAAITAVLGRLNARSRERRRGGWRRFLGACWWPLSASKGK